MTDLGPLFETPVSRVLAAAPAAVKTVLDRYTHEPLLDSDSAGRTAHRIRPRDRKALPGN